MPRDAPVTSATFRLPVLLVFIFQVLVDRPCAAVRALSLWTVRSLFPRLPDFLQRYPDIQLHLSEGDRLVDLVREGVDCVLRVGSLSDSTMIGRSVAMLDEVTVASPAYLKRHGTPRTPDDPTAISAAAPVVAARARLHRVGQSGILCRRIEHSRSSAQHMNLHRSRDRATLPKSNPPETGSTPDCPGKKRRSDFRHIAACRQ